MISEYKPVGSKIFHSFENVKNTESELLSMANETFIMHQPEHNSSIFGFQETTPTKFVENAAIKQLKEVEDPTLHGYTPVTSEKTDVSMETSRKEAEGRSRLLSSGDAYFIRNKVGYPLRSPSFKEQQGISSVEVGDVSQPNPFLGFKSIFSFLFE